MGRYPFLEYAMQYMGMRKGFIADSTYDELERKMRYLNKILVELRASGKISTTNPKKITRRDIAAIIEWARRKGLQNVTIGKYLGAISKVCLFTGNGVFEHMKAEGERLPGKTPKEMRDLSEEELVIILRKASEILGWSGEVGSFIMHMYPYTGLRPSELRLAHIEDIDTDRWTMFVRHPKGEGSYAKQRTAPILPPARPAVLRFLKARTERLRRYGVKKAVPLIPARHNGGFDFYSSNRFRVMKKRVEEIVNAEREERGRPSINFNLKIFRDTYCQMNLDMNPELLSDISLTMGHASTRTTELHYGRIKERKALERIQRAWESRKPNTPLIENHFVMSGYA